MAAYRAGAGQEFSPMLPFPKRRGPQRLRSRRPTRRPLALEPLEGRTLLAATITVNTTLDTNDSTDSLVTLREAILIANGTRAVSATEMNQVSGTLGTGASDRDTIAFNIPGTGVHTIQPATVLPAITDPVILDGYTQPGASPNTLAVGTNAVLRIEVSGTLIPVVNGVTSQGLDIPAGNTTVRGLVIGGFVNHGIIVRTVGGDRIAGT